MPLARERPHANCGGELDIAVIQERIAKMLHRKAGVVVPKAVRVEDHGLHPGGRFSMQRAAILDMALVMDAASWST